MKAREKFLGSPSFWSCKMPVLSPEAVQALILTELTIKWAGVKDKSSDENIDLNEARNEVIKLYNSFFPDKKEEK